MATLTDEFNGDNVALIDCIEALIEMNDKGALVPHGIGGHARKLLSAAATRLATNVSDPIAPVRWSLRASPPPAQGAVTITREMFDFLCGSGPLEGYHFGEANPNERGAFWWRKHLIASSVPSGGADWSDEAKRSWEEQTGQPADQMPPSEAISPPDAWAVVERELGYILKRANWQDDEDVGQLRINCEKISIFATRALAALQSGASKCSAE